MSQRDCPACHYPLAKLPPPGSFPITFPPTGDDYDFIDSEATFTCPQCGEHLSVQVRYMLGTGAVTLESELKLKENPAWSPIRLRMAAGGGVLAFEHKDGVRGYTQQGGAWTLVFDQPDVSLIDCTDDEIYLYNRPAKVAKTILYRGFGIASRADIWRRQADFWDYVHTLALDKSAGVILRGGVPVYDKKQAMELARLKGGRSVKRSTATVEDPDNSPVYFNLSRSQALCVQDGSALQLWEIDPKARTQDKKWRLLGEYRKTNTHESIVWVTWESKGTILLAELHNYRGYYGYKTMPYGLVRLDSANLAVIEPFQPVCAEACPHAVTIQHVQRLDTGELLWCTDRIYCLDAQTGQYRGVLPCVLEEYSKVCADATGSWIAVGRKTDVVVYDRQREQSWSLRQQRVVA